MTDTMRRATITGSNTEQAVEMPAEGNGGDRAAAYQLKDTPCRTASFLPPTSPVGHCAECYWWRDAGMCVSKWEIRRKDQTCNKFKRRKP